ncbi:hypothetical protein OG787_32070 [Streptomyces sp. NBC_00075]|uniref:Uncharacterized protein n=1 Tax=Streptomyces sp. NBC_00093 TaxID=2975649 RepID=A0AAU2A6H2_9ACTN
MAHPNGGERPGRLGEEFATLVRERGEAVAEAGRRRAWDVVDLPL